MIHETFPCRPLLLSRIFMVPLWILSSLEFSVMQIKVECSFSTRWPGPFVAVVVVHIYVAYTAALLKRLVSMKFSEYILVFCENHCFSSEFDLQLKSNSFENTLSYTLNLRKMALFATLRLNIRQTNIAIRKLNDTATSWAQPSESFESDL